MNCDCIAKVDAKLKEAGMEYRLAVSLVFDDKMNVSNRLALPTVWNDVRKRSKKPPPTMLCTLCPFCGVSAVPTGEKQIEKDAKNA